MKIDQKIFYISFVIILFLNVAFYLCVSDFSIKIFRLLEDGTAVQEANSMRYFLMDQVSSLDAFNRKWVHSKEAKAFVSEKIDDEISFQNSFNYDYAENLEIDYLSFVSKNGKVLRSIEIGDKIPMPDDFVARIVDSSIANRGTGLASSWHLDDIVAVSIRPVAISSDIDGYVVMVKEIDKKIIGHNSEVFAVGKIDSEINNKLLKSKSGSYIEKGVDNLSIYCFFDDISGKKLFYSKSIISRDIYRAGLSTINAVLYSAFVLQLLGIILFIFLSQKIIVKRLKLLIESIKNIEGQKEWDESPPLGGNDEISVLSKEISDAFIKANSEKAYLSERQKELNLILKSIQDVIIILDENNSVVSSYFPPSMEDDRGYLVSEKFFKIIFRDINIKNNSDINSIDYCTKIKIRNTWYDIDVSAKKEGDSSFKRVILVIRDVTRDKKMQKKTEEKVRELERLNKLMVNRELKMIELKKMVKNSENGRKK
ncbi:MAG: CHASE4 domain-containing protein [Candidatus Paceibacterota bacterium]